MSSDTFLFFSFYFFRWVVDIECYHIILFSFSYLTLIFTCIIPTSIKPMTRRTLVKLLFSV